eukprot:2903315-Pleurochrysis_carterae.AAC.1
MPLSAIGSRAAAAPGTTSLRASLERYILMAATYPPTGSERRGTPSLPDCFDGLCRMNSANSSMVSAL